VAICSNQYGPAMGKVQYACLAYEKTRRIRLKLKTHARRNLCSKHMYSKRGVPHHSSLAEERIVPMNNFMKGVLFGVGIGLLVAPMRGEELRKLVGERVNEMRGYLPENEQMEAYRQQISSRVNQTASTLKDYAQQAASTMKSTASNLGEIAQNAASSVKSSGKDILDTTRDTVNSSQPSTP
jgi:gas vesicle protein